MRAGDFVEARRRLEARHKQSGDKLMAAEKEIGFVTSAAHSPAAGQPVALGYVHRDFAQAGTEVGIATDGNIVGAKVK